MSRIICIGGVFNERAFALLNAHFAQKVASVDPIFAFDAGTKAEAAMIP